jgi:hypothetical protein
MKTLKEELFQKSHFGEKSNVTAIRLEALEEFMNVSVQYEKTLHEIENIIKLYSSGLLDSGAAIREIELELFALNAEETDK